MVFGIKGAIVPMHMWLPDSYPVALTKVTAVFAALLTKAAVYSLIRVETLVFPGRTGRGSCSSSPPGRCWWARSAR